MSSLTPKRGNQDSITYLFEMVWLDSHHLLGGVHFVKNFVPSLSGWWITVQRLLRSPKGVIVSSTVIVIGSLTPVLII
jgi:hypothetical protein